jgi:hypothetical protein
VGQLPLATNLKNVKGNKYKYLQQITAPNYRLGRKHPKRARSKLRERTEGTKLGIITRH